MHLRCANRRMNMGHAVRRAKGNVRRTAPNAHARLRPSASTAILALTRTVLRAAFRTPFAFRHSHFAFRIPPFAVRHLLNVAAGSFPVDASQQFALS